MVNDKQVGGTHYKDNSIQPWDYVWANNLGYFEGSAIKYITRWRQKGGIEDLRKAVHFLEKLISLEVSSLNKQGNAWNDTFKVQVASDARTSLISK